MALWGSPAYYHASYFFHIDKSYNQVTFWVGIQTELKMGTPELSLNFGISPRSWTLMDSHVLTNHICENFGQTGCMLSLLPECFLAHYLLSYNACYTPKGICMALWWYPGCASASNKRILSNNRTGVFVTSSLQLHAQILWIGRM